MIITLHDTYILIKQTKIQIFNPTAFWKYIQQFDSKWDQPSYEMLFAYSGKQAKKFKTLTAGTPEQGVVARQKLTSLCQRIIDTYNNVYPSQKINLTAKRVLTVASTQRLSQVTEHTRQIHYGSKLTDSEGCLLVQCPFDAQFFDSVDPKWFRAVDQWALKGFATQAALYVLSHMEE